MEAAASIKQRCDDEHFVCGKEMTGDSVAPPDFYMHFNQFSGK